MKPLLININDDGKLFDINQGQEVFVSLIDNPTTGYIWHLTDQDNDVLDLVEKIRIGAGKEKTGQQSTQLFKFVAISPGRTNLKFRLARSWETSRAITEFSINLIVK